MSDALFADTGYWLALLLPDDDLHEVAIREARRVQGTRLVTTEEVLGEVLTAISDGGAVVRSKAVEFVRTVRDDKLVEVQPQTHDTFESGLDFYSRRLDKAYSFVDCVSMNLMHERGLDHALAHDHHFEQEGFVALLRG